VVSSASIGAFNSHTSHLQLHYSNNAATGLTTNMILKRNIPEPWGVEAGAQEVAFYQLIAALPDRPPAIVCAWRRLLCEFSVPERSWS
jgi:hypothetical protein